MIETVLKTLNSTPLFSMRENFAIYLHYHFSLQYIYFLTYDVTGFYVMMPFRNVFIIFISTIPDIEFLHICITEN